MAAASKASRRSEVGDRFLWPAIGNFALALAPRLAPRSPEALNNAAWYLATDADASRAEGEEAIGLAERAAALTGGENPTVLDTLAAAYAVAGRFDDAATTAERALAAASREGDEELAAEIGERVELYRRDRTYVRPPLEEQGR